MAVYVYILQSKSNGRYYIGHAQSIEERLAEHNRNRVSSTKNRGPWDLVYTEEFPTRGEAMRRERELKRMKSRVWIEQLVRASR